MLLANFGSVIMPLETCVRSIFDMRKGSWISTEGYMYVFEDFNGEDYAVTLENYEKILTQGRKLSASETGYFFDEAVRGMTAEEESLWECGGFLDCDVDLWGNVRRGDACKAILRTYYDDLKMYYHFAHLFSEYVLYDSNATVDDFQFWKNLQSWVNVKDKEVSDDNKVCFYTWLEENWKCWLYSFMKGERTYMNLTSLIWETWEKV